MTRLLEIDAVTKTYGSDRALASASVTVDVGRIHALVGRNGSGKTTLLRVGAGLERPDAGFVRYRGRLRQRPKLHRLARDGVFFLPADGLLSPRWTVRSHLRRVGAPEVETLPRDLDIAPWLDRRPAQLSRGQRRLVEVTVALVREPRCLLADEPLLGLAPKVAKRVMERLGRLARTGCGILVSGQEVRQLLMMADEVTWLEAGSTQNLGPVEEAVATHDLLRRFLRVDDREPLN